MADNEQSQAAEPDKVEDTSEGGFSEAFAERATPPGQTREAPAAAEVVETPAATDGEPAEQAGSTEAPPQGAADEGSGTKAPAFDPFAGLSPEQNAHFAKLQASERSNRGRVGALTKKLNGLARTQEPPAKTEGQSGGDDGAAETNTAGDIEKRLAAVAEEYGDILGPLPDLVRDLRTEIDGLKASPTRETVSEDDAEAMAEAYDQLEGKHPDYKEIAGSPAFAKWMGAQPEKVQGLVNSYDPQEVSLGLTLYKAEAGILPKPPEGDAGGNGGTATGEKRERQLDGLRQAPNRGAAATGTPNDFGSAFKARSEQHKPA
jgi:hypothetical protein